MKIEVGKVYKLKYRDPSLAKPFKLVRRVKMSNVYGEQIYFVAVARREGVADNQPLEPPVVRATVVIALKWSSALAKVQIEFEGGS